MKNQDRFDIAVRSFVPFFFFFFFFFRSPFFSCIMYISPSRHRSIHIYLFFCFMRLLSCYSPISY
ncbi:hypothetical protein GGS20DRAFT_531556 [Poronia punctata]|nr:hypothetical protein GGS20DRAFT_531556 [Poronia punctata]